MSISIARWVSRRSASERVLGAVTAGGAPLLPPVPDGFADIINTVAAENLARAWAIERSPGPDPS